MRTVVEAQGLSADWLNGWLAAIGITVLIPGTELSWSDEAVPIASFRLRSERDLGEELAQAVSPPFLDDSILAKSLPGLPEFPRRVSLEAFQARAQRERKLGSGHLAASVSDLRSDIDPENLDHGAFDPAAPGTTGSLWDRAKACALSIEPAELPQWIRDTLDGRGRRLKTNGLGFDCRRMSTGVHGDGPQSEKFVDPVVELLCFAALRLFPVRGDGRSVRQRGWTDRSTRRGAFAWSAWRPPLDCWAVDAFLDLPPRGRPDVIARFGVVPYRALADADPTRGYFAERLS